MRRLRPFVAAIAVVILVGHLASACGDDDDSGAVPTSNSTDATSTTAPATTSTTTTTTTLPTATTTTPPTTTPATTTPATTTPAPTTTLPVPLEHPAVWPASDTVVATPQQAAEDFVASVLAVPPRLGEFRAGDSRSGEIEVLAPSETDDDRPPIVRSVLLLRQLGPSDGWFVLAAVNANTTVTSPPSGADVPPGPLTVSGVGRGFEGLVVVEAFLAGQSAAIDQVITQGGSTESSEPFQVEIDLSTTAPGDTVVVVARGGVGLESDPGEFSAIPLRITGS
jgi:hypothetical protein